MSLLITSKWQPVLDSLDSSIAFEGHIVKISETMAVCNSQHETPVTINFRSNVLNTDPTRNVLSFVAEPSVFATSMITLLEDLGWSEVVLVDISPMGGAHEVARKLFRASVDTTFLHVRVPSDVQISQFSTVHFSRFRRLKDLVDRGNHIFVLLAHCATDFAHGVDVLESLEMFSGRSANRLLRFSLRQQRDHLFFRVVLWYGAY